jgi:hypothetical protein
LHRFVVGVIQNIYSQIKIEIRYVWSFGPTNHIGFRTFLFFLVDNIRPVFVIYVIVLTLVWQFVFVVFFVEKTNMSSSTSFSRYNDMTGTRLWYTDGYPLADLYKNYNLANVRIAREAGASCVVGPELVLHVYRELKNFRAAQIGMSPNKSPSVTEEELITYLQDVILPKDTRAVYSKHCLTELSFDASLAPPADTLRGLWGPTKDMDGKAIEWTDHGATFHGAYRTTVDQALWYAQQAVAMRPATRLDSEKEERIYPLYTEDTKERLIVRGCHQKDDALGCSRIHPEIMRMPHPPTVYYEPMMLRIAEKTGYPHPVAFVTDADMAAANGEPVHKCEQSGTPQLAHVLYAQRNPDAFNWTLIARHKDPFGLTHDLFDSPYFRADTLDSIVNDPAIVLDLYRESGIYASSAKACEKIAEIFLPYLRDERGQVGVPALLSLIPPYEFLRDIDSATTCLPAAKAKAKGWRQALDGADAKLAATWFAEIVRMMSYADRVFFMAWLIGLVYDDASEAQPIGRFVTPCVADELARALVGAIKQQQGDELALFGALERFLKDKSSVLRSIEKAMGVSHHRTVMPCWSKPSPTPLPRHAPTNLVLFGTRGIWERDYTTCHQSFWTLVDQQELEYELKCVSDAPNMALGFDKIPLIVNDSPAHIQAILAAECMRAVRSKPTDSTITMWTANIKALMYSKAPVGRARTYGVYPALAQKLDSGRVHSSEWLWGGEGPEVDDDLERTSRKDRKSKRDTRDNPMGDAAAAVDFMMERPAKQLKVVEVAE